jgi:hypothetical protein
MYLLDRWLRPILYFTASAWISVGMGPTGAVRIGSIFGLRNGWVLYVAWGKTARPKIAGFSSDSGSGETVRSDGDRHG